MGGKGGGWPGISGEGETCGSDGWEDPGVAGRKPSLRNSTMGFNKSLRRTPGIPFLVAPKFPAPRMKRHKSKDPILCHNIRVSKHPVVVPLKRKASSNASSVWTCSRNAVNGKTATVSSASVRLNRKIDTQSLIFFSKKARAESRTSLFLSKGGRFLPKPPRPRLPFIQDMPGSCGFQPVETDVLAKRPSLRSLTSASRTTVCKGGRSRSVCRVGRRR